MKYIHSKLIKYTSHRSLLHVIYVYAYVYAWACAWLCEFVSLFQRPGRGCYVYVPGLFLERIE